MDFARIGPFSGDGDGMVLQLARVFIKPVGGGCLEQAAESLDRVDFWTVGWQRKLAEVGRQSSFVLAEVEACMILNDDMPRVRITFGDLIEEKRVDGR